MTSLGLLLVIVMSEQCGSFCPKCPGAKLVCGMLLRVRSESYGMFTHLYRSGSSAWYHYSVQPLQLLEWGISLLGGPRERWPFHNLRTTTILEKILVYNNLSHFIWTLNVLVYLLFLGNVLFKGKVWQQAWLPFKISTLLWLVLHWPWVCLPQPILDQNS